MFIWLVFLLPETVSLFFVPVQSRSCPCFELDLDVASWVDLQVQLLPGFLFLQ